ncbi:MAG: ATP-binding protein [Nitrospirae bacterium]|nr:ATP-binding protein [Nitrospirota bacterium]
MNIPEELLYEEESSTLDFKGKQYNFISADDVQKGELLKDILAFANAWRRIDAYILIGIKEIKGSKSEVIGIEDELDDAQLQQFVNSKTQRPVTFHYKTVIIEDKKVGVIHIPVNQRPIYLKNDYGKLKKNVVYIRRGSATDEASPDEVAQMGLSELSPNENIPTLDFEFADAKNHVQLGKVLKLKTIHLSVPKEKEIPDYEERQGFGALQVNISTFNSNRDYYRELVDFYYWFNKARRIGFVIKNSSGVVANNVRIEMDVADSDKKFTFFSADKFSDYPKAHRNFLENIRPLSQQLKDMQQKPDIVIKRFSNKWHIEAKFEKVQPQQTAFTKDFIYFAPDYNCSIELEGKIFADNLPNPLIEKLSIESQVENRNGSLDEIRRMHYEIVLKNKS